jgi:hypothetical protein
MSELMLEFMCASPLLFDPIPSRLGSPLCLFHSQLIAVSIVGDLLSNSASPPLNGEVPDPQLSKLANTQQMENTWG